MPWLTWNEASHFIIDPGIVIDQFLEELDCELLPKFVPFVGR